MREYFKLQPKKAALLVIDMQRYFLDPQSRAFIKPAQYLAPKIKKLVDCFYRARRPVIFTRHLDKSGGMMSRWWKENILEKDPMSKIVGDFDLEKGMALIKNQYDAFFETELDQILKQKKVSQVVICGVLTNLCCETTARSAFMRSFEVYFVTDATATYKKQMHEASLLNLAYGFATMTKVNSIVRSFS